MTQCAVAKVAIAPFLRNCPQVLTVGVKACFSDYPAWQRDILMRAERIFFPTRRFIDIFRAANRETFPRATTYRYQESRILQHLLFQYTGLPYPPTRIYFGRRQKAAIPHDFSLPCLILGPGTGHRKAHFIDHPDALLAHSQAYNPVLVRRAIRFLEYAAFTCVNFNCISVGKGRGETYQGGPLTPVSLYHPSLKIPRELTEWLIRKAALDDILVEWGFGEDQWWILGLKRPPATVATEHSKFSRHALICELIQAGEL